MVLYDVFTTLVKPLQTITASQECILTYLIKKLQISGIPSTAAYVRVVISGICSTHFCYKFKDFCYVVSVSVFSFVICAPRWFTSPTKIATAQKKLHNKNFISSSHQFPGLQQEYL